MSSGGEIVANFFGDSESLVDAGTDGGAAQVVAAQPKTWETRAKLGDCGQAVGVTEIVLRTGTRPNCGVRKDSCARDGEQRRACPVDEAAAFVRLQLCGGGSSCCPAGSG